MKKILLKSALSLLLVGFVSYGSYRAYSTYGIESENEFLMANVEALAENGEYDYPNGYPYTSTCNVKISKWRKCKVELIICQGGGYGCNEKKCPVHNHF